MKHKKSIMKQKIGSEIQEMGVVFGQCRDAKKNYTSLSPIGVTEQLIHQKCQAHYLLSNIKNTAR